MTLAKINHYDKLTQMTAYKCLSSVSRVFFFLTIGLSQALFSMFFLFSSVEHTLAFSYELEGKLWVNSVDRFGLMNHMPQHDKVFMVAVNGPSWCIDFQKEGYKGTMGCDGTNVYYLVDLARSRNANAIISRDACPRDTSWNYRLIWLAFASTAYLKDVPEGGKFRLPTPWGNSMVDPYVYMYSAKVSKLTAQPFLPTNISFSIDAQYQKDAVNELRMLPTWKELETREDELKMILQDYKHGFLGGEFKVLEYTNYSGTMFPTRFVLYRYLPQRGLFEEYHSLVTRITPYTKTTFVPHLTRPTAVVDTRFRDVSLGINSINYATTNNIWLSSDNEYLQRLKARVPKNINYARRKSGSETRHFIVLTIIVVLAAAPIAIMAKWHRSQGKSQKPT